MLGRTIRQTVRTGKTTGRRNFSSNPNASPAQLAEETESARKQTILAMPVLVVTHLWAYYQYRQHQAHEEHHPYVKPQYSYLRINQTTLPWSKEYPGCTFFDPSCTKAGGVKNMSDDDPTKAWH